jgi:hypothetical protein
MGRRSLLCLILLRISSVERWRVASAGKFVLQRATEECHLTVGAV